MKYLAILLLLSTPAAAMDVREVKQKQVCRVEKIPVNCAYLAALIRQQMKRCADCNWKTKEI